MPTKLKDYLPALACALIPIVCYLLIRPYAEIGMVDDWAYVGDALHVARTGRISYCGGETPMLGWQLYFGALFIKCFGFSFTAVRFSTVIEAMATAFLLERTAERAGLNRWNAVLATAVFVLSPLYFPYAYTFMSDIPGVLCILVCLYMCLRAVEAASERAATVWVCAAVLVNAAGGTVRQIAWLGLLVMVPCTLWLLRKKRRAVVAGGISCAAGLIVILAALHWLKQQPYIVPVSLPSKIDLDFLKNGGRVVLGGAGVLAVYALPVLVSFAGALRLWRRRAAAASVAILAIVPIHWLKIDKWPLNAAYNDITFDTVARLNTIAAQWMRVDASRHSMRILLTGAAVFGIACLILSCFERPGERAGTGSAAAISWQKLCVLLGPFSAAYLLFVVMAFVIYDRYFLPLLAILLLVLARLYQECVKEKLAWPCILLIALFAGFGIAATHDDFARCRGYAASAQQIVASGAPATAILGPQGLEGWAELQKTGHLHYPPGDAGAIGTEQDVPANCDKGLYFLIRLGMTPSIHPAYAVSFNPNECGGQAAYPPVTYRTWVAPHVHTIYGVRLPRPLSH